MSDATITLAEALPDVNGVPNAKLILREPTLGEALEHGDPLTYVVGDVGGKAMAQPVIDRPAITAYARLLITSHYADVVLNRGKLADALAIEDAIKGFFLAARKRSSNSPDGSPSAAAI